MARRKYQREQKKPEYRQMSFRVPLEIAERLVQYSEEDDASLTDIGLAAFQQYIDERDRQRESAMNLLDELRYVLESGEFDDIIRNRVSKEIDRSLSEMKKRPMPELLNDAESESDDESEEESEAEGSEEESEEESEGTEFVEESEKTGGKVNSIDGRFVETPA